MVIAEAIQQIKDNFLGRKWNLKNISNLIEALEIIRYNSQLKRKDREDLDSFLYLLRSFKRGEKLEEYAIEDINTYLVQIIDWFEEKSGKTKMKESILEQALIRENVYDCDKLIKLRQEYNIEKGLSELDKELVKTFHLEHISRFAERGNLRNRANYSFVSQNYPHFLATQDRGKFYILSENKKKFKKDLFSFFEKYILCASVSDRNSGGEYIRFWKLNAKGKKENIIKLIEKMEDLSTNVYTSLTQRNKLAHSILLWCSTEERHLSSTMNKTDIIKNPIEKPAIYLNIRLKAEDDKSMYPAGYFNNAGAGFDDVLEIIKYFKERKHQVIFDAHEVPKYIV